MTLTYILVDFENVQPQAADLSLLRGDDFRVRIFHGAHQNKFDADVLKALLPLGDKADVVQSDRQGPNVLDFHISFYLGRLLQEHVNQQAARFFVISKDRGFDSLIKHIGSLGFEAHRVATIRAALGTAAVTNPPAARIAVAKKIAGKKRSAAKKALDVKSPEKGVTTTPPAKKKIDDPRQIVLASLRKMGKKLPGKRKGLEHHIESHLGRKVDLDAVRALVAQMERDGVLRIVDNKVTYALPKASK